METVTLNNGVQMPLMGYGTYQTPPRITEQCVAVAIRAGCRSIDTAQCYGNEHQVGLACKKSSVPREDLFLTTKLWACHDYQDTLQSVDSSLRRLDLGYIDLLLHEPTGDVREIYRAMETAYQKGKVQAIGVSNFLEERYLDLINHCKVVPAVNQVEPHVSRQQSVWLAAGSKTRFAGWHPRPLFAARGPKGREKKCEVYSMPGLRHR